MGWIVFELVIWDSLLNNAGVAIAEFEDMHRQKVADRDILNNLAWLYHQKDKNRALELAEEVYLLALKTPEFWTRSAWSWRTMELT